jgi:hypothetical protein
MSAKVGILFGQERTFPEALARTISERARGRVTAEPARVGAARQDALPAYDLLLDRISQDVPHYRTLLKALAARGTQVVNNPFWWSADDKFVGNLIAESAGVAVPRTVLLPHHDHPPGTTSESFSNLEFPIRWSDVYDYLGFPIFMKPAYGGGWKDVHRVTNPAEFMAAYAQTHTLTMIAQEAIEFTTYFRCYCLGRERVRIMPYDPKQPHHLRYVRNGPAIDPALVARVTRDCQALTRALGYDFDTLEFAVRDGIPVAIDFMNPAPDADLHSVGPDNFAWIVDSGADFLIDRALNPRPLELTGNWPSLVPPMRGAIKGQAAAAGAMAGATPGATAGASPGATVGAAAGAAAGAGAPLGAGRKA